MLPTRNHPQTPVVSAPEAQQTVKLTTAASRTSESMLLVEASVFSNIIVKQKRRSMHTSFDAYMLLK